MTYHAKRTAGAAGAPLILTFHGTGGSEAQFHGFAQDLFPGAHVASPRGDVSELGALRFFRRTSEGVYDMDDLARASEKAADFIRAEADRTGARRVVGLGYSNGANILATVALNRTHSMSDIVLLHPLIPWAPDPTPGLKGVRILVTSGENDPICPAQQTSALVDFLRAQGATVSHHSHPRGHEIDASELDAIRTFLA